MENVKQFSSSYPLDILILEEGPNAPSDMRNMLINLGYRPEVAADSKDLLRLNGKNLYDVILTDVQSQELKKLLVSRQQTQEDTRPLIIALTDHVRPAFRHSCLEAGMDHFIDRPLDPRELRLHLKACSVLTGKCRVRPAESAESAG